MSEKVKVRIYAQETVRYSRDVEIPAEVADEYDAAVERDEEESWFAAWAELYIDPLRDIYENDGLEDVEMTRLPIAVPATP